MTLRPPLRECLRWLVIQPAHCIHRMFTRMGQLEQAQGKRLNVNFLYTHPTSGNRVKVRLTLS